MKTTKDVFTDYRHGLIKLYDANESEAITLMAVSEICNLSKAKIKAFPELEVSNQQAEKLADTLIQLKTGKPIQYILGKTEFYGLPFYVNPSVLIPRPETEELVQWVISSVGSDQWAVDGRQFAVGSGQLAGNILDIGTGSGCIAISLKKKLPNFKVSAIDISIDALNTAKENADLNQVPVDFVEADILNFKSEIVNRKSEIIVSNPPYVTLVDKEQMHSNVTDFEPHSALFVPGDDPLIFYKAIADFAVSHLVPNGLLFFEINENYGEQIIDLLKSKHFKDIELRKDMSGRDRMVKAAI
ncbi:MAG TPA: peptide chain release factor N(5)-glutamine methyltransferase [Mucilaginibacter sp.]